MRKSLLPPLWHHYIYIFALIVLVVGMPVSKFLMSLSQIILAANWLLEGNLREKWRSFFKNRAAMVASSLLLLHLLGLLWTSDFGYASNDIRIKIPLFVLPLILFTSAPVSKRVFDAILYYFIAAVIIGTLVGTFILTGIIEREVVDIRTISIFISHIRFALLIDIAIFICFYFIMKTERTAAHLRLGIVIIWLLTFLVITESITGLAALGFTTLLLMLYLIFRSPKRIIRLSGVAIIALILAAAAYLVNELTKAEPEPEKVNFSKLEWTTPRGKVYYNDTTSSLSENGHLVWMYVNDEELKESWEKRSKIRFEENDLMGNPLRFTLVRFLASKGLRKDFDGVTALSDAEVKAVERGVVNVNYQDLSSLSGRLHEIKWELDTYRKTGQSNGHSLTMRFEFWKASLGIIKEHPFIGVGTGDVAQEFKAYYARVNSPLEEKWRLRSHNQYLAITVAFGLLGLIWFLVSVFWPMILAGKTLDYLYVTFFIIAIVSFLTEDTLETQAGVTFFAFFNSFFLFVHRKE